MTIKQKIQSLKNLLNGIKIEELPTIGGFQAEQKIGNATYSVITKNETHSQNDYWFLDKDKSRSAVDTILSYYNHFGNSYYYFNNGLNLVGENQRDQFKIREEISAEELEKFMPLVEALEEKIGHLLVKYNIRKKK